MFYSQCLLSRKGRLGTIWVAAHCLKRLKKDQVTQTNISSSVDTILAEEVPCVTHRILAFLLLGIVRIHFKKAEYLFNDCRHLLVEINGAVGSKKADAQILSMCPPPSPAIIRPPSFELDAFNLQILDDGNRTYLSSIEDITIGELRNAGRTKRTRSYSQLENLPEEQVVDLGSHTPVKDVIEGYNMEHGITASTSHNTRYSKGSRKKVKGNIFSLEDRLDPMILSEAEEEFLRLSGDKCETSKEQPTLVEAEDEQQHTFRSVDEVQELPDNVVSFEELMEPMDIREDDLQGLSSLVEKLSGTDQTNLPDTRGVLAHDGELQNTMSKSFNQELQNNADHTKSQETVLLESRECETIQEKRQVSLTVDVTPQSNYPEGSGIGGKEQVLVRALEEKLPGSDETNLPDAGEQVLYRALEEKLSGSDETNLPDAGEQVLYRALEENLPDTGGGDVPDAEQQNTNLTNAGGVVAPDAEEQNNNADQTKSQGTILPESRECEIIKENRAVSVTVDVTPQSKHPNISGATVPDVMGVRTPKTKEHAKVSRKRKCIFDDVIVISNKKLKQGIDDPKSLVCKRKKVPLTALLASRAYRISNLPHSLLEPLLPCTAPELRSLFGCKQLKISNTVKPPKIPETSENVGSPKTVEPAECPETIENVGFPKTVEPAEHPETLDNVVSPNIVEPAECPETLENVGSPRAVEPAEFPETFVNVGASTDYRSLEEMAIAPSTPVTGSSSLRLHQTYEMGSPNRVGPASSCEDSGCENLREDKDLDACLGNEEEVSSPGGHTQQPTNEWSVRTRAVAKYLHKSFLKQKEAKGDEAVNLSEVVKQKKKRESARMFFEILVLKTGSYIDVKQEAPFSDILVRETPKLQQSCES